jgi:type VI secretion system secreted protein Hcp
MAVDMFLKIEGVEGESRDSKHGKEIDVLAWSWGASNSGSAHVGGGSGAGKVNVQDLSFTKYVDKSSPTLLTKVCDGTHFTKATLVLRKAGGDSPIEYFKMEMEQVMVTAISTGGSGGEDRLTENVTLNFAKFKVFYIEQTEKGAEGAKPKFGWDIAGNKSQGA